MCSSVPRDMLKYKVVRCEDSDIIQSGNIQPSSETLSLENVDLIPENFEGMKVRSSTRKENLEDDLRNVWKVLNRKYQDQINVEQEMFQSEDLKDVRNSSQSSDEIFHSSLKGNTSSDHSFSLSLSSGRRKARQKSKPSSNNNISWHNGNISSNALAEPWPPQLKRRMEDEQENAEFDYKIYEEVDFKRIFPTKRKHSENTVMSDVSLFSRIKNVIKKKVKLGK